MTIPVLVCDDLQKERGRLIGMLRSSEGARGVELAVETASDGGELLSMWRPERWELIFLDIYMAQLDGVSAARRLREVDDRCEIVFITTSRDHGMEGYELHALDYLTKPYSQADVDAVLDWFLQKRAEKRRELTVRTSEGEERIRLQEIRWIESRGHTCDIHTLARTVSVRRSIDELSEGVDAAFFRCHKSFLLNLAHAAGIEKNRFLLTGGGSVPISAARLTESKSALLAWKTGTR